MAPGIPKVRGPSVGPNVGFSVLPGRWKVRGSKVVFRGGLVGGWRGTLVGNEDGVTVGPLVRGERVGGLTGVLVGDADGLTVG